MKAFIVFTIIMLMLSIVFAYEVQVPQQPASACFTDLNQDGYQDIILGHKTAWGYTNPSISILLNDGFGRFTVIDTSLSFCGYQENLILHDIDNDGNQDLIALTSDFTGGATNQLRYLRVFSNFSQTNHAYIDYPLVRNNTVFKMICIDLPNDEHAICWISPNGYYWGYFRFDDNGISSSPVFFDLSLPPQDMSKIDLDNDGFDEIVINVGSILVEDWNGSSFTETIIHSNQTGTFLTLGDVNNDGSIEVICHNFVSTEIILKTFPGLVTIDSLYILPNLANPILSDFNGDNYLDVLYTSSLFNPYHWDDLFHTWIVFFNGTELSTPLTLNTGFNSYKSYPVDIDNDGYTDILTLNDDSVTSGHIHILYNDGNGNFLENSPTPNEDNYASIPNIEISCFPNPFRESTNINFKTKTPLYNPKLEIYNIKGQRIKSIELQKSNTRENTILWDGTDNNQKQVSSGIYFYKLITPEKVLTNKMILTK